MAYGSDLEPCETRVSRTSAEFDDTDSGASRDAACHRSDLDALSVDDAGACAVGDVCAEAEPKAVRRARRIEAFHPQHRRAIAQLTAGTPALEDLADSFPALLFSLACGNVDNVARAETIAAITSGRPLRAAAACLSLPLWLRRLPPQAFTAPLPPFSTDAAFGQRMAPLVPADPIAARLWLDAVVIGWRGCHEGFALWIAGWVARQQRVMLLPFVERNLHLLAAWAWHADQPQAPAHRLLRRAWSNSMGHRRALDEVTVWRQRIDLAFALAARRAIAGPVGGHALGYDFVPLVNAEDFLAEADIMDNCLDQFADRISTRYSRVFSIRKGGRSVANVEIGVHDEEPTMPAIRQLRAARNRRTAPEVWQATYAWLGAQPVRVIQLGDLAGDSAQLREAARQLWQPYLDAIEPRWTAAGFRDLTNGLLRADVRRVARQVRLSGGTTRSRRPGSASDADDA